MINNNFKSFHELLILYSKLYRKNQQNINTLFKDSGLIPSHMQFLLAVASRPEGITQQEISDQLFINKAGTSRTIRQLEEKGWVKRVRQKGGSYLVYLTDLSFPIIELVNNYFMSLVDYVFTLIKNDNDKNTLIKLGNEIIDKINEDLK